MLAVDVIQVLEDQIICFEAGYIHMYLFLAIISIY